MVNVSRQVPAPVFAGCALPGQAWFASPDGKRSRHFRFFRRENELRPSIGVPCMQYHAGRLRCAGYPSIGHRPVVDVVGD